MIIPSSVKQKAWRAGENVSNVVIDTLFSKDTGYDTRHVLNLSSQRPNILLADIETNGISLEELAVLNVPVCRYKTQITIHGTFPQSELGYCDATGYKSLVLNKNQSVGVRWIAVDGAKKRLVKRAFYADGDCKWVFHQNSSGTEVTLMGAMADIEELRQAAIAVPKSTYIGSAFVARAPMFGVAWAGISISALRDVWGLIKHFTQFETLESLDVFEAEEQKQAEVEAQKQRERTKEWLRKKQENIEKIKAEREVKYNLKAVTPKAGGHYLRFLCKYGSKELMFGHSVISKSFGKLIVKTQSHETIEEAKRAIIEKMPISNKGRMINKGTVFYIMR